MDVIREEFEEKLQEIEELFEGIEDNAARDRGLSILDGFKLDIISLLDT